MPVSPSTLREENTLELRGTTRMVLMVHFRGNDLKSLTISHWLGSRVSGIRMESVAQR